LHYVLKKHVGVENIEDIAKKKEKKKHKLKKWREF